MTKKVVVQQIEKAEPSTTGKDANPKPKEKGHSKKIYFKYSDETVETFDSGYNVDVATNCDSLFRGSHIVYREFITESFSHIVDLDSFEYHKIVFHEFLSEILQSSFFRLGILFLVLFNAFLIGLQTNEYISSEVIFVVLFQAADQIILGVFIFEILLKWIYDFRLFWKVMWNVLDAVIVGAVILSAIVPQIGNSRYLVIVRVVRAFRSLRSVSSLTSLTIVAHTVIKSILDMANILLVLMLFMIVMSVVGVTLFDLEKVTTSRFLNALEAWYAVFICVTQDGWNELLSEMRQTKDTFLVSLLCTYLIISVSIGAFVFANLIVAVIVANLEMSVRELRMEKQQSENPLEMKGQFSVHRLNVTSVYDEFALNNEPLRIQRPFKLPCFRNLSARRLHAYVMLVVALEQNMLEADLIRTDLERIMSVQLCVMHQLTKLTPESKKLNKKRGRQLIHKYGQSIGAINLKRGTLERLETLDQLRKDKRKPDLKDKKKKK